LSSGSWSSPSAGAAVVPVSTAIAAATAGSGSGSVWKTMMSPDCSSDSLSVLLSESASKRTLVSNSTSSYTASSWPGGSPRAARSTGSRSVSVWCCIATCEPAKTSCSCSGK